MTHVHGQAVESSPETLLLAVVAFEAGRVFHALDAHGTNERATRGRAVAQLAAASLAFAGAWWVAQRFTEDRAVASVAGLAAVEGVLRLGPSLWTRNQDPTPGPAEESTPAMLREGGRR